MTRRIIWAKDDYFDMGPKRIDMNPSVVELPEDDIPIVVSFRMDEVPVGKVVDVRLEDGEITGEVFWFTPEQRDQFDELLDGEFCFIGGFYNNVVQTTGENVKPRVLSCELKGASIVPQHELGGVRRIATGANPGAKL